MTVCARSGLTAILAALLTVAAAVAPGPAPASTPASASTVVDPLQCPSATLCVGLAQSLVTARAPRSATGWRTGRIDAGVPLNLLACPTARRCLIVDGSGRLLVSDRPAAGARSWRVAAGGSSTPLREITSLTCPSTRLCVGVSGSVVASSTDPERGREAWRRGLLPGRPQLSQVACATTRRCVAIGMGGAVRVSTDPASSGSWRAVRLPRVGRGGGDTLTGVACAADGACVIVDEYGRAFATTDLAAAGPAWRVATLGGPPTIRRRLIGVACAAESGVCVAIGHAGTTWASRAPAIATGPGPPVGPAPVARVWRRVAIDRAPDGGGAQLLAVACAPMGLCVVTDGAGRALTATAPADPGAWRREMVGVARAHG